VFGFRSMKDIKKKLKRKRRPILTLGALAGIFLTAAATGIGGAWMVGQAMTEEPALALSSEQLADVPADKPSVREIVGSSRDVVLQALTHWNGDVEVMLRRMHWCGEETRLLGHQTTKEASELLRSHREWEASFDDSGRLVFLTHEEESRPVCHQNAYVGMDADGNLSLFDGPPRKDNVVRTFFQLDVRSLETGMSPDMLRSLTEGIRVADPIKLDSLLSDYRAFSLQPSADVMKRR